LANRKPIAVERKSLDNHAPEAGQWIIRALRERREVQRVLVRYVDQAFVRIGVDHVVLAGRIAKHSLEFVVIRDEHAVLRLNHVQVPLLISG
jgi:hypothetical protein